MSAQDDYRWLTGEEAGRRLAMLAGDERSLHAIVAALRRDFSQQRAHLLLQQAELRRRARQKFSAAERMFFLPTALEQATDESVAAYKAGRFPAGQPVEDLCCGIGGDLLALARRGPAIGVERDPTRALLAEANCRALGLADARVRVADVGRFELGDVEAWHIDPDRRPGGRRSTRVADHEPGLPVIERLLRQRGEAAIKLAPAAAPPPVWRDGAELEWISRDGSCRQLVAWFGQLARHRGRACATLLRGEGARTVVGDPSAELPQSAQVGRFVFEPDAAVLAAGLTASLAAELQLRPLAPGIAYLTGDARLDDLAVACFEVLDVLPFRLKLLKAWCRDHDVGRLEVKKRGVDLEPENLRRQLAGCGEGEAVLLVTRINQRQVAIAARRCAACVEEEA